MREEQRQQGLPWWGDKDLILNIAVRSKTNVILTSSLAPLKLTIPANVGVYGRAGGQAGSVNP
jgi:hypothetical protein